jgi:hypothetical protein
MKILNPRKGGKQPHYPLQINKQQGLTFQDAWPVILFH